MKFSSYADDVRGKLENNFRSISLISTISVVELNIVIDLLAYNIYTLKKLNSLTIHLLFYIVIGQILLIKLNQQ